LRRFLLFAVTLATASLLPAADQNQLDASETLFTVMAAVNAVGFDAGLATSPPLRKQVREAIAAKHPAVLPELREAYLAAADRRTPAAVLTEFISLGLSLKSAPDFDWRVRQVEVPPDALALDRFRQLLPRFYQEAGIADLWKRTQPAIEVQLVRYQEQVVRALTEVNAYLRNPGFGYLGRHFQVYFDLLTPPNVVQTRSYADDYFVVVSPSAEPRVQDIRHAYIYFLMDPLGIKYGMELKEKSSLAGFAAAAPALDESFKDDFVLLSVASLVKAIESRLMTNPAMIDQALREGYILAPYFAEQLAVYEKQPEAMRLYFPKMVAGISRRKESQRLANVKFAAKPETRVVHAAAVDNGPQSAAARSLEAAEDLYSKDNLGEAQKLYRQALEEPGAPVEHARAYYGLARIDVKQKNLDDAEMMFKKTLESSPDGVTLAWSHYYLGQLALNQNPPDTAEAGRRFAQSLAVPQTDKIVHTLAQKALDSLPKN
jgi:tetratricopeptide (TPR) repeat protein